MWRLAVVPWKFDRKEFGLLNFSSAFSDKLLADGAECNWQFLTPHTPVQVLDFYHASSYLGAVANAKYPNPYLTNTP